MQLHHTDNTSTQLEGIYSIWNSTFHWNRKTEITVGGFRLHLYLKHRHVTYTHRALHVHQYTLKCLNLIKRCAHSFSRIVDACILVKGVLINQTSVLTRAD